MILTIIRSPFEEQKPLVNITITRPSVYERARDVQAETPFLAIDVDRVVESYHELLDNVPGAEIFYAVKANSALPIVSALAAQRSAFDVASQPELEKILGLGVPGERIICSNPIKNERLLKRCAEVGVYAVVADSVDEMHKIARNAPGMRVYIRLIVDNSGAAFPLDKKFGVSREQALEELILARDLGLQPIGTAFHVGSQCTVTKNWARAIAECGAVWEAARDAGINLFFLDLGGGYPAPIDLSVPTLADIGPVIVQAITDYIPPTPNLRVIVEPGRGLVGAAGVMVMTVVGRAQRGEKTWLYLDGGVFNGMMEILEGFSLYTVHANDAKAINTHSYTLAGPSCDSADTILRDVPLPEVNIGDRLYILNTGAYTVEYASNFNGFNIPTVQTL